MNYKSLEATTEAVIDFAYEQCEFIFQMSKKPTDELRTLVVSHKDPVWAIECNWPAEGYEDQQLHS